MEFKTLNELTLQVNAGPGETFFTKAGAFIGGYSIGDRNYKFEKVLLGPQGNIGAALVGQIARRLTGENLPLMKVNCNGQCTTLYANDQQHVTVIPLQIGETLSVESENLLAFNQDCRYSIRFLAQGVISQKGFATSTLTGEGPNAMVAILTDGNPLILSSANGNVVTSDPDAVVCWTGSDPGFKLDVGWKNLIGQASGESYMFQWERPATVIIQPCERKSGLDLSMDGRRTGQQASRQQNQTIGGAARSTGQALTDLGGMLTGNSSSGTSNRSGGISNIINDLFS